MCKLGVLVQWSKANSEVVTKEIASPKDKYHWDKQAYERLSQEEVVHWLQ